MDDGFRFVAKQWLAVMDESAHRSGPDESLMIALHRVLASPSPPAAPGWRKEPPTPAEIETVTHWWLRTRRKQGNGWWPATVVEVRDDSDCMRVLWPNDESDDLATVSGEWSPCLPPGEAPSPPAAEPAIVARVEGAVASWWPRGDGAEVKIGGRGWFPAWPGAVKGQRVEVLVRVLDGLEVPAPPASAEPRPLTDTAHAGSAAAFVGGFPMTGERTVRMVPRAPRVEPQDTTGIACTPAPKREQEASAAPRPLTEEEIEECAKAGYDAVPAEEPYDEWNHPNTDQAWWVARAALTLTDRGSLGVHFDEAVRAKAAALRARTPTPKPEETP